MTTHSNKALQTLSQMGVAATALKLTPIKWAKELRTVQGEIDCPSCKGLKNVRFDTTGAVIPAPERETTYVYPSPRGEYEKQARAEQHAADRAAGRQGSFMGNCPTCRVTNRRARMYGYPTGRVPGLVQREVMVGYPQFPAGAALDSRFGTGCNCHLCGKLIPSGRFVPVDDRAAHALWVGEDCARKILAVASPFKVKASELERVIDRG
jgi:cytochrome c1